MVANEMFRFKEGADQKERNPDQNQWNPEGKTDHGKRNQSSYDHTGTASADQSFELFFAWGCRFAVVHVPFWESVPPLGFPEIVPLYTH